MNDWASFDQEVKSHRGQRGPQCAVAVLLKTLPPEAVGPVGAAINGQFLSPAAIERALRVRLGDDVPSAWVIRNHRRGGCQCGRNRK